MLWARVRANPQNGSRRPLHRNFVVNKRQNCVVKSVESKEIIELCIRGNPNQDGGWLGLRFGGQSHRNGVVPTPRDTRDDNLIRVRVLALTAKHNAT
jgi:hypothetical protein